MNKTALLFIVRGLLGTMAVASLAGAQIGSPQSTQQRLQLESQGQLRLSGPDLRIVSYDPVTNIFQVQNVGNRDAVFPQGGILLPYSEPVTRCATPEKHGLVPAGGKLSPRQIVGIQFKCTPQWYCPADPNVPIQYGFFNVSWPYALPEPKDSAGHKMMLVDPDGKVAETNENNNIYQLTRSNPYNGIMQGSGAPDLIVSKIEVKKIPVANGQYIDIYVKNIGSMTAYSCGSQYGNSVQYAGLTYLKGYVDGKDRYCERGHSQANSLMQRTVMPIGTPFVLHPGAEMKDFFFLTDEVRDQYGLSNGGLPPGCHELKVELDPQMKIPGEKACNNVTNYYFATGNAACDPSKVMRTSPCFQSAPAKASQPVTPLQRRLP